MPDGQKRKMKKVRRQPGAPETGEPPASPPAQKGPETAIPVVVEGEREEGAGGAAEPVADTDSGGTTGTVIEGGEEPGAGVESVAGEEGSDRIAVEGATEAASGETGDDATGNAPSVAAGEEGAGDGGLPGEGAGETGPETTPAGSPPSAADSGAEAPHEERWTAEPVEPEVGDGDSGEAFEGGSAPGAGGPEAAGATAESPSSEAEEAAGSPSSEAEEAAGSPSSEAEEAAGLPSSEAEEAAGLPSLGAEEAAVLPSLGAEEAAVLPSLEAEEAPPRQAVMADDELLRLKAELSRRLVTLEAEKGRLDELGEQLVLRHEELEERHRAQEEREESGRRQEEDLSKKSELIHASSEALGALADELHDRHKKVLATEEEVRTVQQEIEELRADITSREQKLTSELATLDENRRKVDQMLADLNGRDATLKEGEVEHAHRTEQLARARREVEEIETRLKSHESRLRKKEEEVRSLEQHLLSIDEEIKLCPHCGAVEEFQQLALRGQELRERGEDIEELTLEIREARNALKEGFYDTAADHGRRAAELLVRKERENARRDIVVKVVAAEGLTKMLREARADTAALQAAIDESWASIRADDLKRAEALAEKARREAATLEQERFQALDALVSSNTQIATLKKSGVNVLPAEKKREEAERSMASGDFRRARQLAAEAVAMVSESAQSQDVSTAMSQIRLAEETIEELRSLGLDTSEWERTLNRSREFLKKLDFKSAEETARWVRQKSKEAGRLYRQALLTIDHCNSVISTYKDMGLVVRKAEELQDEAKAKLRDGDPELATNLARKAERMVKEISERQKGAQAALRKATTLIRADRKAGKDATRSEKLFDLAQHQLELGEYANAMKLANKAVEALSASGPMALELCPTCGEAIPENSPGCPNCAEKARQKEPAERPVPAPGSDLAQKTKLGAKGGRKYACPYCGDLFEIMVARRPITITCPWCSYDVSVVE